MTGSNRRPSACKADALPAELILHIPPGNVLLSQGRVSQLPSALRSLTSVFGMGTGVTFSPINFFCDLIRCFSPYSVTIILFCDLARLIFSLRAQLIFFVT